MGPKSNLPQPDIVGRALERIGKKPLLDETCIVHRAFALLADKWTLLVLLALMHGRKRYSALQRQIGGVSPKMLTQTLRALEEHGLVEREVFPEVPPRVEYALTDFGRTLSEPLASLCEWAVEHEGRLRAVLASERSRG
ncbi:winged helix-turn-helix transcriptional regulator [Pendulispora albinea]|uniref:Helix-turn-helix transcriptional regulator n=1 Tax=Pendulispora albinea TaxID=2741071 RepID=A0ABZ2LVD3_9BACT